MKTLAAALALALTTGCATTLSTFQTARPVEPKHVQVTGGVGYYGNLGPIGTLVTQAYEQGKNAKEAIDNQQPFVLSEEDQQQLLTAGIGLAVMFPSSSYEVGIRTGLVENWDVGLRYSVNAVRLDTKYRLFHQGDDPPVTPQGAPGRPSAQSRATQRSFDVALGLGVSRYLFKNPVFDALELVRLGDFSRWDFEVPLYMSAELGEVLKLYGAPKWVYSRTSFDQTLVDLSQQGSEVAGVDVTLPSLVHTHFFGATAGLAVGFRYVHLMLELTAGYTVCNPVVFGQRRFLGGVTLYPAAGIGLSF
ncbi:MAG: hypothetical protein ACOZIN_05140 [Myxococcota bacterium]